MYLSKCGMFAAIGRTRIDASLQDMQAPGVQRTACVVT